MAVDSSFAELVRRVRAGDQAAASELVRLYEADIRRWVRLRMAPRLRRLCDSIDICQSVLGSFFVRATSGQFDLETPEQLLKLLGGMARNKLTHAGRYQWAARRDQRRVVSTDAISRNGSRT